jgi:hypothetical protein
MYTDTSKANGINTDEGSVQYFTSVVGKPDGFSESICEYSLAFKTIWFLHVRLAATFSNYDKDNFLRINSN